MSTARIFVITQEPSLLTSVRMILAQEVEWQVSGILWSQSPALLRPDTLKECDLVVAELFRTYDHGTRAEGVILAERFHGQPPFLIIAPRYRSHEIDCPGYWDVAAEDSLLNRIRSILKNPLAAQQNFERLQAAMSRYLAIPKQH